MRDPLPVSIRLSRFAAYAGVVVLAAAASLPGFGNGFALDDLPIVADSVAVHSLHHVWRLFTVPYWPPQFGASLYRPFATTMFALEWSAGGGAPWVFHAVSIALYAVLAVAVLAFFRTLVPPVAAFMAAALFAVHPVHVEAVANVVGQEELIATLATVCACVLYLRSRLGSESEGIETLRRGAFRLTDVGLLAILFAIACFSKEHGLLLPVLLGALELLVVRTESGEAIPMRKRIRDTAPLFITLAIIGAIYLTARVWVVGDVLGEKDVIPLHGVRRVWTMLTVAPHWVRLLLWPAHLSADYAPQQIILPEGPGLEIVLGAIVLLAAAVGFIALGSGSTETRRERAAMRLGLAWAAITILPVSNLFSAMILGERTLLAPSVGTMLIVAVCASFGGRHIGLSPARGSLRIVVGVAAAALITLGIVRSRSRQLVWRDDATLFAQTVEDAPRSYRAQFFYGQMLFEQGKRSEGERRLRLAIALNPTPSDVSPLNYLATQYRDAGMCTQALPLYERAIANDASRPDVRYGLASCLSTVGRTDDARRVAFDGQRRGDLRPLFDQLIAHLDSAATPHAR